MDGYVSVRHYKIRIGKNNFKKKKEIFKEMGGITWKIAKKRRGGRQGVG